MATGWNMKALLVLILVSLAAATVMAYGRAEVVAVGIVSVVPHSSRAAEPFVLLLSGSALIGLAGALRRSSLL